MAREAEGTEHRRVDAAPEVVTADTWQVRTVDELTGKMLTPDESAFRAVIRSDREQGVIAVDAVYYAQRDRIHEPLTRERGVVSGSQDWELARPNATTLRVPRRDVADPAQMEGTDAWEGLAVRFAHSLCGPRAALVMEHLYTIANEPPYWRRPRITISIAELADRMGYTRDERGVHRDHARKEISRILLALHYTHVGLQSTTDGESTGVISPLLAKLEYSTREDVADLSPQQVFERGLPDNVTVVIGWFGSIRDDDGHPMHSYVRTLAPTRSAARDRSNRSGASTIDSLRRHVLHYYKTVRGARVDLARTVLLEQAGITNRNVTNANKSLRRALDALVADGTLCAYEPLPLPLRPTDLISLHWNLA